LFNDVREDDTHKTEFNAADLSGGIYFYRLRAGGFNEVRTMLLVK
jgi:hypothetical protein